MLSLCPSLLVQTVLNGLKLLHVGFGVHLEDDCVHPVHRTTLGLSREELLTPHGTSDNVAHKGVSLWQVSCEVHLLPTHQSDNQYDSVVNL